MFRRPRFRPIRRAILAEVSPLLRRSNQLFDAGNYLAAADAFEELAREAQAKRLSQDAPLFMKAGHCRLLAGQTALGMADFKQGLGIMLGRGKFLNLQRASQWAAAELTRMGLIKEADEILAIQKTMVTDLTSSTPVTQSKTGVLPTTCPSCGGSLHSDEVEWIDHATAECSYCGAAVRAE